MTWGIERTLGVVVAGIAAVSLGYYAVADEKIPEGCQPAKKFIDILRDKRQEAPVWQGTGDNKETYHVYASQNGESYTVFRTRQNYACPVSTGKEWGAGISTPEPSRYESTNNCPNGYDLDEVLKKTPKVILEGQPNIVGANRQMFPSKEPLRLYGSSSSNSSKQDTWALIAVIPVLDLELSYPVKCTYIEVTGKNGKSIPFKEPGMPI